MAIDMIHPVTLETVQQYAINSGLMCYDVDIESCENAAAVVAKINSSKKNWLGATSGTTSIEEGRKTWSPDHNGLRMPWKGAQWLDSAQPSIKAKLVQMNATNLRIGSGATDISGTTVVKALPRTTYADEDYHKIVWLTNYGESGLIAVVLKNALCTTGLKWSIDDKKVATCDVEFLGHADSPTATDYLPIEYYIFTA